MPASALSRISFTSMLWMVAMSSTSVTPDPLGAQEPSGVAFFEHADLQVERAATGRPYLPFLSVPTMRAGLYELAAGSEDGQQPHERDELYYVVEGNGRFTAAGETTDVGPGSVLFVAADVEHRFHDISSDLSIVVFFSEADPGAETSHTDRESSPAQREGGRS